MTDAEIEAVVEAIKPHLAGCMDVEKIVPPDEDVLFDAAKAAIAAMNTDKLEKAIEPVRYWYESDEEPVRPVVDIIADIVSDLQEDRKQSLRIPAMEAQIYIPGVFRCAKCDFQVIKSTLNMQSGTMTANDEKGEKCPNDGAILWRVTYKDQYAEMMEISERIIDEKAEQQVKMDKTREALEKVAGKNDLSDVQEYEIESAARNALYECELIAREALAIIGETNDQAI